MHGSQHSPQGQFFPKSWQCFSYSQLNLMVANIHSIRKRTFKSQKLGNKMAEDSRVKRSLFQISYEMEKKCVPKKKLIDKSY